MADDKKKPSAPEEQTKNKPKIRDLAPDKDPSGGKRHPNYPTE